MDKHPNYNSKSRCNKGNIDKFYGKNNNFIIAENIINKVKKMTNWRRVFAVFNHKGLVFLKNRE